MKKISLLTVILFVTTFALAQHDMKNMPGMDTAKKVNKQPAQPVFYTCVMHPEIHSPKPGNCPKCGMKLVKEKAKAIIPPAKKEMDMPMPKDTAKHQHDMEGMNMNDMPKEQAQSVSYSCVMHPEIHSPKPGNCPKCGMKLVKEQPK
ncbi:MAG: heavy metal-binding domain-containing protein, partial [Ferruginibacter sp.]